MARLLNDSFGDPRAEHLATRNAAGLFDFSFMSLVEIRGRDAVPFLGRLQTRTLARLAPGRIAYTLLLREDGTVFIDATLWRHADGSWWLFTGRPSDAAWIAQHAAGYAVELRDRSGEHAILALQGPASGRIVARLAGESVVRALSYFHFSGTTLGMVGRLGYSGELGYEIVVEAGRGRALWQALLAAGLPFGLRECGFAAADSLRIESGYVLFGREIGADEDPYELALERLIDSAEDFIGRQALAQRGHERRLVGFTVSKEASAEAAMEGHLTSECDSPLFGPIGLGFVAAASAHAGRFARLRDGRRARIAATPFYDPSRRRPRVAAL